MANKLHPKTVAVMGLGRFGKSLALELVNQGTEVLGIDSQRSVIDALAGRLTHAVIADSTNEEAMRELSVDQLDRVVVGVGTDLESSILSSSVALHLGVPQVWAKATTKAQAEILTRIGVHHVVRPEHEMGRRVAHLVRGRMLDYIEFDDGYAFVKTRAPRSLAGIRLGDTGIRSKYGVTIVGAKSHGQGFTHATADTVVQAGDLIIVSGPRRQVERFSDLS